VTQRPQEALRQDRALTPPWAEGPRRTQAAPGPFAADRSLTPPEAWLPCAH
jgi:hypothetical protein